MSQYHLLRRLKILSQVSKYFPVTSTNIASSSSQRKCASNISFKHRKIWSVDSIMLYNTQTDNFNKIDSKTASIPINKNEEDDDDDDDDDDDGYKSDENDKDVEELEGKIESIKVKLPKKEFFIKQIEEASVEEKAEKALELFTNSYFIDHFSREERLEIVQKIWNNLATSTQLTEEFCVEYLKFVAENCMEINLYIFFSDLLKNQIIISETITLLLLECFANLGKKSEMDFVVQTMKEKNLLVTEEVDYLLMFGNAKAGDLNEVKKIFEKLKLEGDSSQECHAAYLKSLACLGEENLLMEHYDEMQKNGIELLDEHIFGIVEALLTSGHLGIIQKVLKWKSGFEFDKLKSFILKLLRLEEYDEIAFALIPALPQFQDEDMKFVARVMSRAVKSDLPFEELVSISKLLISKKASKYSLHSAAFYLLREGRDEESCKMFKIMKDHNFPIRSHYFWPILARLTKAEKWEDAFKVLEKMKEFNVDFSKNLFFYFHRLDPDFAIFKISTGGGWDINVVVQSFLINRVKRGNLEKINNLLSVSKIKHVIEKVPSRPVALSFAQLVMREEKLDLENLVKTLQRFGQKLHGDFLISLARLGPDMETMISLLKLFSQEKLKISENDSRNLKVFVPLKTSEVSDLIDSITEWQSVGIVMALDSKRIPDVAFLHRKIGAVKTQKYLEQLIVSAKSSGADYTHMLCNLLSSYVQCGDLKKAANVRNEMLKLNIPVSPGIKAKLFALSTLEKDLESSTSYYADLVKNHPDFGIDRTKVLDFVKLLIENDFNEEALRILKMDYVNVPKQPLEKLQSHSISFLKKVAEKKSPLYRQYAEILVKKRYAKLDARLYAPLIHVLLEDDDYLKACEEFKYCVTHLRVAPYPQNLIMKLVEKGDKNKLEEIIKLLRSVHNIKRVNTLLCFAFADLNRLEDLKNIINKFEGDFFKNDWTLRHLEYRSTHGMSDPLECLYFAFYPRPEANNLIPYIFQSFENNEDESRSSKFLQKLNEKNIEFPKEHFKLLASKLRRPPSS